jgi:putative ABC transport system substrate-binding protein
MAIDIGRRQFVAALGGVGLAWPLAAHAQQSAMPVIGLLGASPDAFADRLDAFRQGLSDNGYVEGRNVAIEYRWVQGRFDRLPALVSELVSRRVSLIGAFSGTPGAFAAKAATATIPIVAVLGVDPVRFGLVASLNRPGGNITGITLLDATLGPKHVQLLRELVPTVTVIGFLANPDNPNVEDVLRAAEDAARSLGLTILALKARNDREIEQAFTAGLEQRVGALIIGADPFFNIQVGQIAARVTPCDADIAQFSPIRPGWRPHQLRNQPARRLPPYGRLCRSHSQGREAGRSAGPATDQVRACHQSQDRYGARPHGAADHANDRRRGD